MPDVVLRAILLGDSAGLIRSMGEGAAATDAAGKKLDQLGKDADESGGHLSKLFSSLGSFMSNQGLPFGESVTKIGEKLEGTGEKGSSAFQKLSVAGGLAFGALAIGAVAFAGESLEMADKFDEAQSQLQVAIKNSGGDFDTLKPKIDAAYGSMANLGFNSTEVATSLTGLVTSTGSTTESLNYLQIAANLARLKHISLTAATGVLTKTLAGSTRALTSLGLNLDIGSAKLTSIHSATQSLADAQIHLKQTQEEVAAKVLTGVKADVALQDAHLAVSNASEKLRMDQSTLGTVMDDLKKKTDGAAAAYGDTLPGEMDIAKAHIHDFGTEIGVALEPVLKDALHIGNEFLGWLIKTKPALIALGALIGGPLVVAISAFAIEMGTKFVSSIGDAISSLGKFVGSLFAQDAATTEAVASQEVLQESMATTGEAAEALAPEMDGAFGPIGIAIGALIFIGIELATHWKAIEKILGDVWHGIRDVALDVWGEIKDHLGEIAIGIATVIGGPVLGLAVFLAEHWRDVEKDTIGVWDDIVGFFEGIPGDISSALHSLVGDLETIATDAWHGFESAVKLGISAVEFYFVGFPDDILKWLGDVGSLLLNTGHMIIEGLIHGIENGAKDVKSAMGSIAHDALHAIEDPLSIFSPSQRLHWTGEMLMAGLRDGIIDSKGLVTGAMGGVASDLSNVKFDAAASGGASSLLSQNSGTNTQGFGTGGASASERPTSVTVNAETNADPHQIAAQVAWVLKTAAV